MVPARSRDAGAAFTSLWLPGVSISTLGRPMTSVSAWIDRAVSIVSAPFDHFEEHPLADCAAVELEIFGRAIFKPPTCPLGAVVQDIQGSHALQQCGVQPESGFDIGIIVGTDVQHRQPSRFGISGGREDIIGGERNSLDARAKSVLHKARSQRLPS